MAKREKENLKSLLGKVRKEGLFLAIIKNKHNYPQLVVSSTCPTKEGIISFCFFVFPYIINRVDDGNKTYTSKEIHETIVYPYEGEINGIFGAFLEIKTSEYDKNIEKLKALKELEKNLKN